MSLSSFRSSFLHAWRSALALGLAGLIAAPTAQAQQPIEIPEIVVSANQTPTEASRVGSSVTVLEGEELRAKNIVTVTDALRTVPGVTVTPTGGRGTVTQVRIRGDEANHLMVLIDGIEVNSLGDGGFDFADLTTGDVERIEVIRGPQSGLYGANAQSGVISIITLSGKGLRRPVIEAKAEGGSHHTAAGRLNVRGASGPVYGSLTVSDYTTSGYNISRFGSERDGSRALTVTGKAGMDITNQLNVEAVIRHTDRSAESDPQDFFCPTFPICSPTFGLVIDGNASTTYTSTAGRIGARLSLFDGSWIQSANIKIFDEQVRGFENGALIFGANGTRTTADYKSTVLATTDIAGGEKHSLTLLVDHRREDFQQLVPRADYRKERIGLAGEYVLDLPTATTLSAAGRHDWNSGFTDVFTWRFALSQRLPAYGTRIHASIGKGVTDPNVFELFGSIFNLPNPNLKPEQTIGWDAGVEQKFLDGRVITDVTYFSTDFTDKIELTFDPVTFDAIYLNSPGTAIRRGVEVTGTFLLLDWLTLQAVYTYTDAKNSAGMREVRRPPHSASLAATALFADRRGRASLGIIYNGVRKDFRFTPTGAPLIDLPSFVVVRGSLSYDISPNATVFVRAENILDTSYEEVFSYRAPGAAVLAGVKLRTGD